MRHVCEERHGADRDHAVHEEVRGHLHHGLGRLGQKHVEHHASARDAERLAHGLEAAVELVERVAGHEVGACEEVHEVHHDEDADGPVQRASLEEQHVGQAQDDAVTAAGIEEIYIVRGYYGEQFDALLYKYPNIKFIENPMYSEANNISSLMAARYLLQGSYVIESDLLLSNPALIKKYQYHSNYLAIPMERSDDWCFDVNKKGVIERVRVGGDGGVWQMVGISYWTPEDGRKLVGDIEKTISMPGGKERYWDEVALTYCAEHYEVHVRECSADDIVEIDTFKELQALDGAYAK